VNKKGYLMDISVSSNIITITGNIKTVQDFQSIKSNIDTVVANQNSIVINLVDSLSITSSVIGYFNKLVLKDKVDLTLGVGNEQLIELLEDLSLKTLFKARKI
jgi:hypothetical protein